MTDFAPYPVPFRHAIAAVDANGAVIWSQGDVGGVFPLASVTKIVTAMSTLVAVQERLLDISDPVGADEAGRQYSVAHLLSHSSGLASEGDGATFRDAPGRRRIYSNQGFDVLGEYLREKVDQPLTRWMDRSVYQPLGLRSTVIPKSPASSGFGNAIDMTLLIEELLNPYILSERSNSALTTTVLPGLRGILPGYGMQKNNAWGLGAEVKANKRPHWTPPEAVPATFGHFGMSGSFLWVDPVKRIGATFLGDLEFGQWHKDNWPVLGSQIMKAAGY